jgi:uncharacterized membrane protein YeaQ/YmgE (transglycosylase-associated protein family)
MMGMHNGIMLLIAIPGLLVWRIAEALSRRRSYWLLLISVICGFIGASWSAALLSSPVDPAEKQLAAAMVGALLLASAAAAVFVQLKRPAR